MKTYDDAIAQRIAEAPLPTQATLKRRKNLFWQFLRFIAHNVRIMRMVIKGHG